MKRYQKIMSCFLVVSMLVTSLPSKAIADQITNTNQTQDANSKKIKEEPKIIKELTEKRNANTKYFLLSDGTYEAVEYQQPVHYLDNNGIWQDINNSLQDAADDSDTAILNNGTVYGSGTEEEGTKSAVETTSNDFKVKIAKNAMSKNLVSVKKGNYQLSWNLPDANNVEAQKIAVDQDAIDASIEKTVKDEMSKDSSLKDATPEEVADIKQTKIENEKIKTLKNIDSKVLFSGVFQNVDLEYENLGNMLKENIVLNDKIDNPTFKFDLKVKNLVPKLDQDNNIIFYDSKDTSKVVYKVNAPYMYDANYKSSNNIQVSLNETKKGYELTMTPDEDWLNSSDISYPVTIDPPIQTSQNINSIQDTYVSLNDATNQAYYQWLKVGNVPGSGLSRSYIKFDLPKLSNGDIIVSANLGLAYCSGLSSGSGQINVHSIRQDYDTKTLTWGTQPAYNNDIIQDFSIVNGSNYFGQWDITKIAKDWYTTGNNYGLVLEQDNGGYSTFASSDYSDQSCRPTVCLYYVNTSGIESYWTYHSQDVGSAGTGYVNDFNGNLVFVHNDYSLSGNRMPISISHVYNSNDYTDDFGLGCGWRLNYDQTITPVPVGTETWYQYIDENGGKIYFKFDSSKNAYVDLSGKNLTMTIDSNGLYIIKDKQDGQMVFTKAGYLYSIADSNNNKLTVDYSGTRITKITDGSGRYVSLLYTDEGYLHYIQAPDGSLIEFQYGGTNLTSIFNENSKGVVNKSVTYGFDGNNNFQFARNADGYQMNYQYYNGTPYKVKLVQEYNCNQNKSGQQISIDYGSNLTTFTDVKNRKTIYEFNNSGNTISVRDDLGRAKYYKYDDISNVNSLTTESKLQSTIVNYISNQSADSSAWTSNSWAGQVNSSNFSNSNAGYSGGKSLSVSRTNSSSRDFYQQYVDVPLGKTVTLSAYVKTNGITSSNGGGAFAFVYYYDNNGNPVSQNTEMITGTNDWQQIQLTFTNSNKAGYGRVQVGLGIVNEVGTAYFDCIQLEDGSVANRYNMVQNGDFKGGSASSWTLGTDANSTDDKVVVDPQLNELHPQILDANCYQIKGVPGKNKNVYQKLNLSGKAGDSFVYGGWARADSAPLVSDGTRQFQLCIGLKNPSKTQWASETYNGDSSQWQYLSGAIKASIDYTEVDIYLIYYNDVNTAYFDGISLYKEEFGNTYQYDSSGNLVSATNLAEQTNKNEFDSNNNLTKAVDPKGNNFNYTYDDKHNIKTGTSAENVVYSFTYDANGNPLTSRVGDDNLSINSTATYTTSGNYLQTITDALGNKVTYNTDEKTGNLLTVQDAKNNTTSYHYNPDNTLDTVSETVDGNTVSNSYHYNVDNIDTITNNGTKYTFGYDDMRRNTTVSVSSATSNTNPINLITNNYDYQTGQLNYSTYGNNQIVGNDYDDYGRPITKYYTVNNTRQDRFKYQYDASGNIGCIQDLVNSLNYRYTYDSANRLTKVSDNNGNYTAFGYDNNNNGSSILEKINGAFYSTLYSYDKDNRPTQITFGGVPQSLNDGSIENFSFSGSSIGSKGTKPFDEENLTYDKWTGNSQRNQVVLSNFKGTENLIKNCSSFESQDINPWVLQDSSPNGRAVVKNGGVSGAQMVELYTCDPRGGTTAYPYLYQDINLAKPIADSQTYYTLSAYVQSSGNAIPELGIEGYDANNVRTCYGTMQKTAVDGQWTRISYTFNIKQGTVRVEPLIRSTVTGTGVVRYDDVQLEASKSTDINKNYAAPYTSGVSSDSKLLYDLGINKASGTMSLWFNSLSGGARQILSNEGTNRQVFNVYVDDSNNLNAFVRSTDTGSERDVQIISPTPIQNGTWNFLAISWTSNSTTTTCNLYLNGTRIGTQNVTSIKDFTGGKTGIGNNLAGAAQLNGYIADFSYSSKCLTDAGISSLYNNKRGSLVYYKYDNVGRLTSKNIITSSDITIPIIYKYKDCTSTTTTTQVASINNNGNTISYNYDANGNILTITNSDNSTITYTYNELNELKTEVYKDKNGAQTKEIDYQYDADGNIKSKTVNGTIISYTYDSTWTDLLKSYNGQDITYEGESTGNNIGNPASFYINNTKVNLTWEEGRQLQSIGNVPISNGTNINYDTLSFSYNDNGVRTKKVITDSSGKTVSTTNYHLVGDKVTYEDNGTDKIYYTYDNANKLVSMNLTCTTNSAINGEYYYIRNAQGDIIGLIDGTGTQVVGYNYDSWGKLCPQQTDANGNLLPTSGIYGSLASTVGVKNPYRYRGYRYDTETGLYYLNSRYYNPDWGRFINADALAGSVGELLSHNVFAYCENNPVNAYDPTGFSPWWFFQDNIRFGEFHDATISELMRLNSGLSKGVKIDGAGVNGNYGFSDMMKGSKVYEVKFDSELWHTAGPSQLADYAEKGGFQLGDVLLEKGEYTFTHSVGQLKFDVTIREATYINKDGVRVFEEGQEGMVYYKVSKTADNVGGGSASDAEGSSGDGLECDVSCRGGRTEMD